MYPPPYVPIVPGTTAPRVQPLMKQLLALTGSVQTPDDLTVGSVEKVLGIKLERDPDEPDWYHFSQKLTDIWYYGILLKDRIKTNQKLVTFSLSYSLNNYSPITDVCIDMGEFNQALLEQNYKLVGMDNAGGVGYMYSRGRTITDLTVIGESDENAEHDCVKTIAISVD